MKLIKTPYHTKTGVPLPHATHRIEFFFHYWQYVFSDYPLKFDLNIFKSHRTILNKIRLQVNGNYRYSKKYIDQFYLQDHLFAASSPLIGYINTLPIAASFASLHANLSYINTHNNFYNPAHAQYRNPAVVIADIDNIERWLDKYYAKWLVKTLLKEISKNTPMLPQDISLAKKLINGLIVELLHAGYDRAYVVGVPTSLFEYSKFPFKKIFTDFPTAAAYEEYKKATFKTFTIKTQLEGITNLISRKPRTFYVIFRVDNVELDRDPIKIFDVEFYNPLKTKKVKKIKTKFKFFHETFSFPSKSRASKSKCNLILKVRGYREESLIFTAYRNAVDALYIFNKELSLNGVITLQNAFLINENLDRIYGSTDALKKAYDIVEEVEPRVEDYFKIINKLKRKKEEDLHIIKFISQISFTLSSKVHPIKMEELWYAFESTFGTESSLLDLVKNSYKLYNHKNLYLHGKLFLHGELNNIAGFSNPTANYILQATDIKKYGLEVQPGKVVSVTKYETKLTQLKNFVNCQFVSDFIDGQLLYQNNRPAHEQQVISWIEYIVSELYVERNLRSHRRMNDDFFYYKRFEIISLAYILLRTVLPRHIKNSPRISMTALKAQIHTEAAAI